MKIYVVLLLMALSWTLTGCGEESSDDKSRAGAPDVLNELTSYGEMPGILGEGLSAEEKDELFEQIMPGVSEDVVSAEEKFKAYFEKAREGDAEAQNGLGVMYYTGEAVSKTVTGQVLENDPALAAGWFYRAAEQGYADAQFNLGLLYANGEGVAQDMEEAVKLFKQAAEQGHVDAQNNLGAMYYTGEGVPRDEEKAIEWFERAAALGNAEARANLDAIRAAQ